MVSFRVLPALIVLLMPKASRADDGPLGPRVTLQAEGITLAEAIDRIGRQLNCRMHGFRHDVTRLEHKVEERTRDLAQSVRERLPEFAVLKTIGFSGRALMGLVVLEAGLPCVIGAAAGIALSGLVGRFIPAFFPPGFGFPMPTISPMVMLWAALSALALAFASAALPALRLSRMDIATALSGGA